MGKKFGTMRTIATSLLLSATASEAKIPSPAFDFTQPRIGAESPPLRDRRERYSDDLLKVASAFHTWIQHWSSKFKQAQELTEYRITTTAEKYPQENRLEHIRREIDEENKRLGKDGIKKQQRLMRELFHVAKEFKEIRLSVKNFFDPIELKDDPELLSRARKVVDLWKGMIGKPPDFKGKYQPLEIEYALQRWILEYEQYKLSRPPSTNTEPEKR